MGTSINGVSTDSIKLDELIAENKKAKKVSNIALATGIISLLISFTSLAIVLLM